MRRVRAREVFQLRYLPRVMLTIQNWPRFLLAYADIEPSQLKEVRMRSGTSFVLRGEGPEDAATIAVVFVKREYGDPPIQATVLDVGANIGSFAIYAASRSADTRVYAFEPSPKNFALLQENVARKDLASRVFLVRSAVAGKTGTKNLYVRKGCDDSLYERNSDEVVVDVCSLTLQDVILKNELSTIDLLKLDVEGAEFEILYATPSDYLRRIRAIRMEYHNLDDAHRNVESLLSFMQRQGFATIRRKAISEASGLVWLEQVDLE